MTTFGGCDLDDNGICRKCKQPASEVPGRLCPCALMVPREILESGEDGSYAEAKEASDRFFGKSAAEETAPPMGDKIGPILHALEAGLEYAVMARNDHDISLGRSTRKNRQIGEAIDKDIEVIERQIEAVKQMIGK